MIPAILPLSGQELCIDGHVVRVGVPRVMALLPAANLISRMVTIKGFMEQAGFLDAAARQLGQLGISGQARAVIPLAAAAGDGEEQPLRRVLRVKDKTIIGFALRVDDLTAEESLKLQEAGLGGRRHMGCGIFRPVRGKPSD
jgi:CRISPR-associated protein Cas6